MATHNEKEVKTKWPVEIGTTAATTKQVGKKYLHPTDGTLVPKRLRVGIGD